MKPKNLLNNKNVMAFSYFVVLFLFKAIMGVGISDLWNRLIRLTKYYNRLITKMKGF
jgi:hypothetical protein